MIASTSTWVPVTCKSTDLAKTLTTHANVQSITRLTDPIEAVLTVWNGPSEYFIKMQLYYSHYSSRFFNMQGSIKSVLHYGIRPAFVKWHTNNSSIPVRKATLANILFVRSQLHQNHDVTGLFPVLWIIVAILSRVHHSRLATTLAQFTFR